MHREPEHIAQEGAVGCGIGTVENGMGPDQHGAVLVEFAGPPQVSRVSFIRQE
jgi:hypothetical protein